MRYLENARNLLLSFSSGGPNSAPSCRITSAAPYDCLVGGARLPLITVAPPATLALIVFFLPLSHWLCLSFIFIYKYIFCNVA